MNDDNQSQTPFAEDDPLQSLIGQQLRSLYDEVLSEPIPDKLVDLLSKLDDVPVPTTKSGGSREQ